MYTHIQRAGLLLLFSLLTQLLCATTFYVRTDGNDANDGLADNSTRALRTIQKGVDKMRGGDVLIVGNGTYNTSGLIYIDGKSGTAAQRTIIKAQNRWGAKIRTANLYGAIEVRNSSYITIQNFDVGHQFPTDGSKNQGSGIQSFDSDYVNVLDNYVHDCGCGGISFREGDYATIQGNVTRDNAKLSRYNCSGISVYQPEQLNNNSGFHIVIRRNVSFENECTLPFDVGAGTFAKPTDGNGIILDDFQNSQRTGYAAYKAQTLVENNLVFNNGGAGIKVFATDNATIRNNTAWHNNRILKNYSGTPGDIAVTYSPGIFEVYNNVSVSLNEAACSALEYINSPNYGYMNRQSNLLVGTVKMPSDNSKWGASNDLTVGRSNQGYPQFANATTSIGSFSSVNDFDQYFRLKSASPGANSGNNGLAAGNDLEGTTRPQNGTVERGCYEGATSGGTSAPVNSTTFIYQDGLASGWSNWSYGGTVTLQDGGIKKNGSVSAKFYSTTGGGALSFQTSSGKTGSGLQSIKFWARKWTSDANYTARFRVRTTDEAANGYVNFSPTNTFQEFTFTKAQLGNPATVKRTDFGVPNGNTLWVDDVRLIYTTSSQATLSRDLPTPSQPAVEVTTASAEVFPNPSDGKFTVLVELPTALAGARLRLVDGSGRVVDELHLDLLAGANTLRYDFTSSELPVGVYTLQLSHATGMSLHKRLTID